MLDPKQLLKGIGAVAFCGFAVFYLYNQVIGVQKEVPETEAALAVSFENTLSATGYILRSETILTASANGTILSVVDDGEKVSAGMEVANLYTDGADTGTKARLDEIERKLDILESSIVDQEYFSADVAKLEKDKNEILTTVSHSKAHNKFSDCIGKKTDLLVSLNKLSTVKYGISFEEEIRSLERERVRLASHDGASYSRLYSPASGYYYSVVDGYENCLSTQELDELSYDGFQAVMASEPDQALPVANAGKIVTNSRWYVLLSLPRAQTAPFKVGEEYSILFPYASDVSLKMELYRNISETDKDEDILIFSTNEMPHGFSYTRMQKVEVVSEQYEGLQIPKTSLRMLDDGTKGVYVLIGDAVRFKRAEEIYQSDDSYIIRYETEDEKEESALTESDSVVAYPYLSLYDNVIVGGKELYDGKRLG